MISFSKTIDFILEAVFTWLCQWHALVRMTHLCSTFLQMNLWLILSLGTIVGYNFVKYDALARANKKNKCERS
jgi:hypothetical protein